MKPVKLDNIMNTRAWILAQCENYKKAEKSGAINISTGVDPDTADQVTKMFVAMMNKKH